VGAIYEKFELELAAGRRRDAGRPRREMIRLLLLALEREEIVAVGYREAMIAHRLEAMPIGPELRDLIQHAMAWAWKDEEMHAIYLRGAILRLGSRSLKARAYLRQVAGAIAGWSSSVQQHVRWRQAPAARCLAAAVVAIGSLTGQVPRDVRQFLRYGRFRTFCQFNVDAELTARLCYDRMLELVPELPELPPALADDLRRVRDDEARHAQLFAILVESLDDQDRLASSVTPVDVARQIGVAGEDFLPRRWRPTASAHPLGAGRPVWVEAGQSSASGEKRERFRRLLDAAGLEGRLRDRERVLGRPAGSLRVAIKPTFMFGYHRKDRSVVTDPELLVALADRLHDLGCADVAVVEAPNLYDRLYANRRVLEVARYLGLESPSYRLVDLSREQVPHTYRRGLAQGTVGRTWKEADFRISFGKMRSQPVELAYLSLSNVESMGARCDEYLFSERQAERETAIMMLLDAFPPHFALLDAYDAAADGLVGVMGCARPQAPHRLYASPDALALDMVAARHMGVRDPRQASLLRAAGHWFGAPSAGIEVVGVDEPLASWRGPYHNDLSALLSILAMPVYVWGSGRGTLFVPEMDEEAFPPLKPEGRLLRLGRRAVRRLLGWEHPRARGTDPARLFA
jgi:uncharacterized protein (DUF362 family)